MKSKSKKDSRFIFEDEITIKIPVNPLPQKETAFTFAKGRKFAYTPPEKRAYMEALLPYMYEFAGYAQKGDCLRAVFKFFKPPTNKANKTEYWLNEMPDTDNLVKPVKDCLGSRKILKTGSKGDYITGAGVIWDDCQIVMETAMKMSESGQPRIEIKLSKIIDTTRQRKPKQEELL